MSEQRYGYIHEQKRLAAEVAAQDAAVFAARVDDELRELGIDPDAIDHEEPGWPKDLTSYHDALASAMENSQMFRFWNPYA